MALRIKQVKDAVSEVCSAHERSRTQTDHPGSASADHERP